MSLLLAAMLAAPAAEEGTEPLRLTLAQALERARHSSRVLAQAQAVERAAEADVALARSALRPQLDLSGGYTRQSDVPELTLALPGQPPRTLFPNIPDNSRLRVAGSVPLYTGGRLASLLESARRERAAAAQDVRSATADLLLETATAYWSLATARRSVEVLREAEEAFDAHLVDAGNRERFGLAPRNEVLAVQVERERAELARVRAEGAADIAQAQLARLLDLPLQARVETEAVPEAGPASAEGDVDALGGEAFERRSELASLAERVAAAESRLAAERAARRPQVAASAGYEYAHPNRRILPPTAEWQDTWDVSVNLSLSLFDGGRASAAAARARARADAAKEQLEDAHRRVLLQVTQRLAELRTARAAAEVAARSLLAATENEKVAADRYREGVIPSSERLDAEVVLLRAGLERTEALAQVELARAALERALGR